MLRQAKKLVAVSATFMSMTEKKEELERVSYIWYSVTFKDETEALFDLESEVNAMSQVFTYQLDLDIWKTNVSTQKINNTFLETYKMVVSNSSVVDKDARKRFLEKSFLLANVKLEIVLEILFLIMKNANVNVKVRNLQ